MQSVLLRTPSDHFPALRKEAEKLVEAAKAADKSLPASKPDASKPGAKPGEHAAGHSGDVRGLAERSAASTRSQGRWASLNLDPYRLSPAPKSSVA